MNKIDQSRSVHDDTGRFDYRRVWTDAEVAALRERNEARAKAARKALGTRYLLHPANRVTRRFVASHLPFPSHRLGGF